MAKVIIAIGSNKNNPLSQLKKAKSFLKELSDAPLLVSSVYQSEPVGPSEEDFLNAAVEIETDLNPEKLFGRLKNQEKKQGRPSRYPKWTARTLDLDIISYNNLVLETDNLIIPHAEYSKRLFVLIPLREIFPDWKDIVSTKSIDELIKEAPEMRIKKTKLAW